MLMLMSVLNNQNIKYILKNNLSCGVWVLNRLDRSVVIRKAMPCLSRH